MQQELDKATQGQAAAQPQRLRVLDYSSSCDDNQNFTVIRQSEDGVPFVCAALTGQTLHDQSGKSPETHDKYEHSEQASYNKKPGTAGIKGHNYKVGLAMLFLLEGIKKTRDGRINGFQLAANMQDAGQFRDIVFKYRYRTEAERPPVKKEKTKIIFLNSRHVDDVENKRLTLDSLLPDSQKRSKTNLELNLQKYFRSYRKIKRQYSEKETDAIFGTNSEDISDDFVIYTNALSTFVADGETFKQIATDQEDILYFGGRPQFNCYYQLIFDLEEENRQFTRTSGSEAFKKIENVLRNASDCRKLAKELAKSVFPAEHNKTAEIVHQGILKTYQIPLGKIIIRQKEANGNYGIFRSSFLGGDGTLSQADSNFKADFFEEAKLITEKSEDDIKQELSSKCIKLSHKFGDNVEFGETENSSFPQDRIGDNEVKDFLCKLKLFTGQPSEHQLAEIIKQKMGSAFKIEHSDVNSIFSDVKDKMEKWWQEENCFLTEKNRFFHDSIRISISFNVKKPVESFTGRKRELGELHNMMQMDSGKVTLLSQVATVVGLGGIGKTELVRQYIQEHSRDYDDNIMWINAENYGTLVESFRTLAENELKINVKNVYNKEKDISSVVQDVYKYFKKRKSLFVFDNAEKRKTYEDGDTGIDKFLPSLTRNDKTYVVITSRSQEWENVKTLILDIFTEEEAAELIRSALNIKRGSKEAEVKQLSEVLQRFPLALQQAVAYIREEKKKSGMHAEKFSIGDYLELFKMEGTEVEKLLLDFQHFSIDDYGKTTFITWKITLEKIQSMQHGAEALDILNTIGYFAPRDICTKMFLRRVRNKRVLGSALQLLAQYSIISSDHGSASIHRLVQKVIRVELKRQRREREVLVGAIKLLIQGSEKSTDIGVDRKYTSHAISVWEHASKYEELVMEFSELPVRIVVALESSVKFEEGCIFAKKSCVLLENVLGIGHLDTLTVLYESAVMFHKCGRYKESMEAYQYALLTFSQTLGPNDPYTLAVKNDMADLLVDLGRHDEALKIFQEVLEKRKQIFGDDHPETLNAMYHIAEVLRREGRYKEASEIFGHVLRKREDTFGPDDLDTLPAKHGVALVLVHEGRYNEALVAFQDVLEKTKEWLPPDHPGILLTKLNIASVFFKQGHVEKSQKAYHSLLDQAKKVLGRDHPITLSMQRNIARVLQKQGRCAEALTHYREVLDKEKQALDPDHADTLLTQSGIAKLLGDQKLFDPSLKGLIQTRNKQKHLLGPCHPDTLGTKADVADVLFEKGFFQKALEAYAELSEEWKKMHGPDHPDTFSVYRRVANVLLSLGRHEEAMKHYQEILDKMKRILGSEHPDVLEAECNIARVLYSQNRFDLSLEIYEKVLIKREKVLGPRHLETLMTRVNIGRIFHKQHLHERALNVYREVLGEMELVLGFEHACTMATQADIAAVLHQQRHYTEALEYYQDVFDKREQVLGSHHSDTLATLSAIACVLEDQEYLDLSLETHNKVLEKRKQCLGPHHPDTLKTEYFISGLLVKQMLYEEALEAYSKMLEKSKKIYGPDHPCTLSTQLNRAAILQNQGNCEEALNIYQQVLEKRKTTLGSKHPDTLAVQYALDQVLCRLERFDFALESHQKALDRNRGFLGPDHPDTLTELENIAGILFKQDLFDEAEKAYREVLYKRTEIQGPDHPSTLLTQHSLNMVLGNVGKYEEDLESYKAMVHKLKRALGTGHPDTLFVMDALASMLYDEGQYVDAAETYIEIQNTRKRLGIYELGSLHFGNAILHELVKEGGLDVIKRLVEGGADVLARDHHDTVLHNAVANDNVEVMKFILNKIKEKAGNMTLHIDSPDEEGDTPLMWAAELGKASATEILLEYGASVDAKNESGQTAIDWAAKKGHQEIVNLLLRYEADACVKDKNGETPFV